MRSPLFGRQKPSGAVPFSLGLALVLLVTLTSGCATSDGPSRRELALERRFTDEESAAAIMAEAREAQAKERWGSAIKRYRRVVQRHPRTTHAPEALYQQGQIRLLRRQYTQAFEAFEQIIRRYPNYGRFDELIALQFGIAQDLVAGRRPYIWGWLPGPTNRSRGVLFFEAVVRNAPFADTAPTALMNAARGHARIGNEEEAIDAFDRLVQTYPAHPLAPDAYLALAETNAEFVTGPRYDQGATREALSYFQDFTILYPQHPRISEAEAGTDAMRTVLAQSKVELGNWYFRFRQNYAAARVLFNEAITTYPESAVAEEARRRIEAVDAAEARFKANPPTRRWRWIDWLWR